MNTFLTFINKWSTGSRFWYLLGTIELVLLLVQLFTPYMGALQFVQHSIIMWLAFATAEILNTINVNKSDNP